MSNLNIVPVPKDWLALMAEAEGVIASPVYLIGGALRDLYMGRPVKDLDLFYHFNPSRQDRLEDHFRGRFRPVQYVNGYNLPKARGIASILVFTPAQDPRVPDLNFIGMRKPVDLYTEITAVDFGICQVGCASGGVPLYTDDFIGDALDGTFTYCREAADWPRSARRFERLQAKYPGFTLRNAPEHRRPTPIAAVQ